MSEISNSTINYHSYNAHEGEGLIDQVVHIITVLLPRGILIGGFSEPGDLIMIRYGDYSNELSTWILDFYEHRFVDEPLLQHPEKVKATYIASDKYMVVPEGLFQEADASEWLSRVHFLEGNELVSNQVLPYDHARYVFAWSGTIKSLVNRYFTGSRILPFGGYQFFKPYKSGAIMQCCITADHVVATLYYNKELKWHQVFPYETGEDIAYQIHLLCKQQRISLSDLDLKCTVTYRGLNRYMNEMAQYFPHIKDGEQGELVSGASHWQPAINLLQQLYACAL